MDIENQQTPQAPPQPPPVIQQPKKPNIFLISLSVILLLVLLSTSIMTFNNKPKLKPVKNVILTPTIFSPSPTTIMKEEYTNPFSPTVVPTVKYNNPFEQTSNPFDQLTK